MYRDGQLFSVRTRGEHTGPGLSTLGDYLVPGIALLSIFVAELIIYVSGDLFLLTLTNLFYLGVVLAAYFFPEWGLVLSAGLGLSYAALRFSLVPTVPLDLLPIGMQSLVICSTGVLVSHLTGRLKREEQKFRTIFDEAEVGIVLVDQHERVVEVNAVGAAIIGLDGRELDGIDVHRLWQTLSVCGDLMQILRLHGQVTRYQSRFRRPDGSWGWLTLNGRCLEQGLAVLVFLDITEEMREHDELRRLHEEEHLLLDIVTHDINNINMAAIGYAELILLDREGKGDTENEQALIRTVNRSMEIIRNINTLRRLHETEGPELRPILLDQVIRDELSNHPGVQFDFQPTGACVWADSLVSEVFTNLIGNAVKFGGPKVRITIRPVAGDGPFRLLVADDGPGIPASQRPSLFFRYSRGPGSKSGRGLGLYITRILLERYGGGIRLVDPPGGTGTAFELTFRDGRCASSGE